MAVWVAPEPLISDFLQLADSVREIAVRREAFIPTASMESAATTLGTNEVYATQLDALRKQVQFLIERWGLNYTAITAHQLLVDTRALEFCLGELARLGAHAYYPAELRRRELAPRFAALKAGLVLLTTEGRG